VIVACAIFFMVAFAILELVTRSLIAAKAIQQRDPDPGIILASLSLSNALEEVSMSGNYEDIAPACIPVIVGKRRSERLEPMVFLRSM